MKVIRFIFGVLSLIAMGIIMCIERLWRWLKR